MVFILLFVFPVESQSQTYPFKHYSTADGLVHAAVRKVCQDSRGFLWFGTGSGVSRYDGHEFKEYLSQDTLKSSIYDIWEDDDGTMWFATYGNGLITRKPNDSTVTWMKSHDGFLPGIYVTVIFRDDEKNIWLGVDTSVLVIKPDGTTQRYDDELGGGHGEIYAMTRERNGTVWIGTQGGLLRCRWHSDGRLQAEKVLDKPTRSLLVLKNGDVLAGTSGGGNDKYGMVCRFRDGVQDTLISYATTHSLIKAQSMYEDIDGNVWIGTGYGMYILRGDHVIHLRTENGLYNENIYDIMQDREGTMWFGTENGAMKLPNPRFLNYSMKEGLSSYVILSMLQDRRHNFWFGMWNGLNRLDAAGHITRWDETEGLFHHTIRTMAEDVRGNLWVGTPLGFNIISSGKILKKHVDGLAAGSDVWSLCRSDDGGIWLAVKGKIIKAVNGAATVLLEERAGVPDDYIKPLFLDRAGTLWFGTSRHGAGYYRDGKIGFLTKEDGLPDNLVHAIYQDKSGRMWIGTERGVIAWQDGKYDRIPFSESALETGAVYFVMADSMNHLWFGTEYGVYEWTGSTLQHFSTRDGLAADIAKHGLVAHDGELWFGTHGGVSRLDKTSRIHAIPTPAVYLDMITVGDEDRILHDNSIVGYKDRSIVFRFNALSFVDEAAMEFQWMMEGFDRAWLAPHRQRLVRYTNLEPGKYVFAVRAANRNGNWSTPTSFTFTVRPPFWKTWWFISFAIVSIGSILALFYRYRVNQLLRVERMRTRIAADLHDDIASSLASVALYSEVIQRQLQNVSGDVRALLGRIRELSREAMENIGTIVWAVDPRRDQLAEVMHYFQRHAAQLCTASGISFVSHLPEKMRPLLLSPEKRRTIYLILKEGLNNILRHAQASQVEFTCTLHERTLHLRLRDNGHGFDIAAAGGSGRGLTNMRTRAEAIGADMDIESQSGVGTTLRLKVRMT